MITILQCVNCKYRNTLKWNIETIESNKTTCIQYEEGIPDYVENGTEDCPKFEEK